ncbi:MAG: xanthan lyase, partial [Bacteroidia bacterium]|nr:xanthan lyase [Bacteroidia bacterium]
MSFLHNAGTVAKYEAVILRRSWFFRLFAIGSLVIFTFMNIGLFSPVGDQPWELMSIPSTIPLINLYLLNIGQAIVVIFLAADFLRRDKKLDTNEVLYTRSMSNFEYVLGKTWGIIRLFLGLNIIILSIGLLMNVISKGTSVDILSYLQYMLIFTIPTIVFSLGLAFLLMSVIRNQAITFLLLLGIAALDMFWLWYRAGSIFDYMAFGLPVYKSQIIGFDNVEGIFVQRLLFFSAGMAMVMGTVLIFKRLPQSKLHTFLAVIFLILSVLVSVFCGYKSYSGVTNDKETRKKATDTNREFENRIFPVTTDISIELIHKGENIEAEAYLRITNDNGEPIETYLFSLNPSLTVNKITAQARDL